MTATPPTPADALPAHPSRGDDPDNFRPEADAFVAALPSFGTQLNDLADNVYDNAVEAKTQANAAAASAVDATNNGAAQVTLATAQADRAETEADRAETQANSISSNVNFKGNWSDQTGTANVPYSVYHNNAYWQLLTDIADVTLSEPSLANSDWAVTGLTTIYELTKTFAAGEIVTGLMDGDPSIPVVSITKEVTQIAETNNNWKLNIDATSYDLDNGLQESSGSFEIIDPLISDGTFNINSYEVNPRGLYLSPDGTNLYVIGISDDSVDQFTMSTPFDISTMSHTGVISISSQTTGPKDVFFKTDGTKMYVVDGSDIFQYSLSTAWDITTATYDSVTTAFSTTPSNVTSVFIKPDGTKLYALSSDAGKTLYQWDMSTPWDVSTLTYDSVSFDFTPDLGAGTCLSIDFSYDGTRMFMMESNGTIHQYTLLTPWVLATGSTDNLTESGGSGSEAHRLSDDGLTMYIVRDSSPDVIEQRTLSNAFDFGGYADEYLTAVSNDTGQINSDYWTDVNSMTATETLNGESVFYSLSVDDRATFFVVDNGAGSRDIIRNNASIWEFNNGSAFGSERWVTKGDVDLASYTSKSLDVSTEENSPHDLVFNGDGTMLLVVGTTNDTIYQYDLLSPYDISTASYSGTSFSVASEETSPRGIAFSNSGLTMFIVGNTNNTVYQYDLLSPYDISTASYSGTSFSVASEETNVQGITFNGDGSKMFIIGITAGVIYEYDLITPFDVGTASYSSTSFSVASEELTPRSVEFNSDGTIMYVAGNTNNTVYEYDLTVAYDISTASYASKSFSMATEDTTVTGLIILDNGSSMFMLGATNDAVFQYSIPVVQTNTLSGALAAALKVTNNQMDKTQLDAAGDADYPATTSTIDIAMTLLTVTPGTTPTTQGASINYDGNVADKYAILGTDVEWRQVASGVVEIEALLAGNYKVRVI
jgi:6-phosphogluconolactonase (cycloisomerase 2 family)